MFYVKINISAAFLLFFCSIQKKIENGKSLPANRNTTAVTNSSKIINTTGHIQDPLKQCNVSYVKIGCYADVNIENSSFPLMILKPVLPLLSEGKTWSLRGESWNKFLKSFVCSCAQKAKQLEYNYFGVKRFDQCWSGDTTLYYRNPTWLYTA